MALINIGAREPRKSEFSKYHQILVYDGTQLGSFFNCTVKNLTNGRVSVEFIDVNNLNKTETSDGLIFYSLRDTFLPEKSILVQPQRDGVIEVKEYTSEKGIINQFIFGDATKACEFLYKYRYLVFDNLNIYGELFSKYLEIKKEHESKNEKI